jgi:phosphoglycolate phosphatase-like HAD superfamily hydrolase
MPTTSSTNEARAAIVPGFAWDGQEAYLFDIDGTLLRSRDRVHFNCFASSIQQVTGFEVSLSGVAVHGNTDTGIVRDACRQAGISSQVIEPKFQAILDAMCQTVAEQRDELDPVLMPGVEAMLDHLTRRGALLGVATGNLERIGWIKIEEAGLRQWFRFGGFSDQFPIRSELIGHAARKARELAGAEARVCVVGDTPRDIQAARANSLPVIAVATGHYSFEELLQHEPEVCASSLADLLALAGDAQ